MMKVQRAFTHLFGVPLFNGTKIQALELICRHLDRVGGKKSSDFFAVFTPNTEQVMLAQKDAKFLALLQHADLNLPDGMGVVLASWALELSPRPQEKIAGREVVEELCHRAAAQKWSIFLLGGRGDVAKQAAGKLEEKFPNLRVTSDFGSPQVSKETPAEFKHILEKIRAFHPDILCVAYGAPHQEQWVMRHRKDLARAGVRVVMVVGGTLDILAGKLRPTPKVVSTFGGEWLWRLAQEPWRWRRQLALPKFWWKVFLAAFQDDK